jgi:predicted nucleic acid-binding protein
VAALVDTNILVYRYDHRYERKQRIATEVLRRGADDGSIRLPHQAIIEFVSVVTRPVRGHIILPQDRALREAEEFFKEFKVLFPNEMIVREAVRGCAAYRMTWFDAHLWAYAEHYGLTELLSEDLEHDRYYGTVHVLNPFLQ